MKIERIPTENPQQDQWKLLGQFAYTANIRKYLSQSKNTQSNTELEEYIAGCIRQAESYFIATKNAPLDISPLLLYYGSSNLLTGIASLITGNIKDLSHHGMRIEVPKRIPIKKIQSLKEKLLKKRQAKFPQNKDIQQPIENKSFKVADFGVIPLNPNYGALQYFCNVFSNNCPITSCGKWTLEEIFGAVPDLRKDFENCYEDAIPHTIQVDVCKTTIEYPDKDKTKKEIFYERINPTEFSRIKNTTAVLLEVEEFSKSYLYP